jgi:hypothetical protein
MSCLHNDIWSIDAHIRRLAGVYIASTEHQPLVFPNISSTFLNHLHIPSVPMASVLANVAQAAHSAAAAMLSAAQIEAGDPIPQKPVKEEDPEHSITLDLSGKNIIARSHMSKLCQMLILSQKQLGVPGAFTPPCSSQVPQYIADYEKFKEKGVKNIYVVAVNDAFVVK